MTRPSPHQSLSTAHPCCSSRALGLPLPPPRCPAWAPSGGVHSKGQAGGVDPWLLPPPPPQALPAPYPPAQHQLLMSTALPRLQRLGGGRHSQPDLTPRPLENRLLPLRG
ncbi:alpha-N-acetylgalactosaminide alpha-2,6-sialyltransferase 1 [Platysternon megacephalum]|uniref:Alpha-N-acetylgalactosaminide alpha-2,6-sialyltransferase 1 n=1 Tax=Platysternon megacephalum TaxID=55544 RepID=A0A4D9DZE8_9SAUR|nr:alpha-N-acetylgalactosaminide alpha-2,6-sialyltransferase 1 [Platysternon megacephalum]